MEPSVPLLGEYQSGDQRRSQTDTTLALSFDLNPEKEHAWKTTRWNTLLKHLLHGRGYILAALPRFMQPGGLRRKKKLVPTSYLDALRGYAAWSVVNHHRFEYQDTWIVQQPFFRLLFSGRGMVDVFFVISGYVLSYRLLILMRNGETGHMLDALASSTFRRYLRLYISAGVAAFIAMLLVRLGWIVRNETVRRDTFFEQLYDWIQDFGQFSNPFANIEGFWNLNGLVCRYLDPLWTIPVEFRGSMVVFIFCTAACKLSTRHRMILCWIMVALSYYWRAIYVAMFLCGMYIADVSLSRHPQRLRPDIHLLQHDGDRTTPPLKQPIAARVGYVIMFIAGLFLLGQSEDLGREGPFPWQYLSKAVPKWDQPGLEEHFWLSIGAFMLVFALESYPALQKPLTTNFSQYLGDLSFGLYAMHMLVIWTFYDHVLGPLRDQHLGNSRWGQAPIVILYYLMVLWAADCFTRIDSRVVRLGRYLQHVTFLKWKE